mmetsp:Transcript_29424/g.68088  ORF Transcript_29424/g.68088 Transcript_29424/m.68088 type:complete len:299 (-) Transcript_29424:699-1595(-)
MAAVTSPFRNDCLAGKVALVTGGGSGICFEITRQLLLHGCVGVVICGRRKAFLERACQQLSAASNNKKALYHVCDVRDAKKCKDVVEYTLQQFGRIDVLVNGAAGNFLSQAQALTPKGFRTVMEIDTLGTYHMTHACFHALRRSPEQTPSVVMNISATLQYGATWYQIHASAAKSAVDSMTRSWALEWGSEGIRVVGMAPGPVADTPGTAKLAPDAMTEMIEESIPLGKIISKLEIALSAVFLCSNAAKSITGEILVVDGGQWLYKPPVLPPELVAQLSRKVEAKSRSRDLALPRSKL